MSKGGGRLPSSVDVDASMSTALSPVQLVSLQFTDLHLIMPRTNELYRTPNSNPNTKPSPFIR